MAELIDSLTAWIAGNSSLILAASLGVFILLTLIYLLMISRLRKIVQRYHRLLAIIGEHHVEQLLLDQVETVRSTRETVDGFEQRLRSLEIGQASHLQRIGVVRYNAFAATGSDLSFSVALLDGHYNGVVITSIHGRDEARTYAKPVVHGQSSYVLSREELSAIERAAKASAPAEQEGKRPLTSE